VTDPAVIADRKRRARLANMRQELLAPVTAPVGYGELLCEEADRLAIDEPAADLERILTAARDLLPRSYRTRLGRPPAVEREIQQPLAARSG
jgi:signal transduction histidine kinase